MSEIEFKTSNHTSKIWILLTMQRFKLYDTFVYAQFYEILEKLFSNFKWGIVGTKETLSESFKSHIARKKKGDYGWKFEKEKKNSCPTSPRLKTWIVFNSLYIETPFLHFFLSQLRSISSTFLSPSEISADVFPANFFLFLSVAQIRLAL